MSIEATLTIMPPTELRKFKKDPRKYVRPKEIEQFDLYGYWSDLDEALVTFGEPLKFTIMGADRCNWDERDEDEEMDTVWDADVSPALVKKISRALAKITDEKLLAALKQAGIKLRKYEQKDYLGVFETLKSAYRKAAKNGAYVCVFIC
jgi:hypothetical protein